MSRGFDMRVEVLRPADAPRNAFNETTGAPASLGTLWAQAEDLNDNEKLAAGVEATVRSVRFTFWSGAIAASLTGSDVLRTTEGDWNIVSSVEGARGRARTRVVTAKLLVPGVAS